MTGFGYNVLGFGAGASSNFNIVISSNTSNFNLQTYLSSNSNYNGSDKITARVEILSGVTVNSTSHTTPAFQTGTIGFATTGSLLTIVNKGTIIGAGGRGGNLTSNNGNSTNADGKADRNGGDGGTALKITMTTIVDNGEGSLLGGGGG